MRTLSQERNKDRASRHTWYLSAGRRGRARAAGAGRQRNWGTRILKMAFLPKSSLKLGLKRAPFINF